MEFTLRISRISKDLYRKRKKKALRRRQKEEEERKQTAAPTSDGDYEWLCQLDTESGDIFYERISRAWLFLILNQCSKRWINLKLSKRCIFLSFKNELTGSKTMTHNKNIKIHTKKGCIYYILKSFLFYIRKNK